MTTPRPYLWQSLQLRAAEADGTGGIAHYFTEEAQSLYLHDGICSKELYVEDGHWQDLEAGDEVDFDTDGYNQMSWVHPATGSLYGSAILPDDIDTVYLLRYTYAKDVGTLMASGKWSAAIDNPINQFSASIKSFNSDAITKSATLFTPGARVQVGLMMGDSNVCPFGTVHLDEISYQYNANSFNISGRNKTGYILNDSTFNEKGTKTGTLDVVCKWVLDFFEIDNYEIEETLEEVTLEYEPSMTGLQALQTISDKASGILDGEDWEMEERYDGVIVIGFNAFRAQYLPKSIFKFNGRSELFSRGSSKIVDGAYSKVYCTGTDSNNNALDPVIEEITTWKHWNVMPNKTYFAPTLEGVTQAELAKYAKVLAKQLKRTGLNETYNTSIKPQLLVGDYATVQEGESETDIGIITQVTHNMGEKGFFTDFVADSGGDKKNLITRSNSNDKVYTSTRRNNGDNRKKRLMDYIKGTAQQVVRISGGGSGGGGGGNVDDVKVNGTSVVQNKVAKITSYKEVTQNEYDNLPASKTSDGIAYFIKDSSGRGGASTLVELNDVNVSSPTDGQILTYDDATDKWVNSNPSSGHTYSTTEQVVGTWIDGKPIYEKTVYLSFISYDTSWHTVAHNISNLKRVIDYSCIGLNSGGEFFSMPNYRPTLTQGVVISIDATNIRYLNNWQDTAVDAYVLIRYTKTTD